MAAIAAVTMAALLPCLGAGTAWATSSQPITPNGPPVTVNVPTAGAGNEVNLTFTSAPGQVFSVQTSQGTFNSCDVQVSLVDPDGQTVAGPQGGGAAGFLDATPADDAGQYFVRVAPSSTATGSVMVNLYRFTDQAAALTAGTGVAAHVTRPGQNFVGNYAGTAGGRVSVNVTGSTFPNCDGTSLSLLNPNGTTLATTGVCGPTLTRARCRPVSRSPAPPAR